MISLIEAIFGSKVGRLLAEIAFALIVIFGAYHYVEHKGAAAEIGKLQAASAQLVTSVTQHNAADTKQYEAAGVANQEKTNAALAANASLSTRLADSVRDFDAYRRAHPGVASTTGADGAAQPGECGLEDCGAVVERLAVRGNELAGSTGQLSADLQSCQRDRDALTGEPKE